MVAICHPGKRVKRHCYGKVHDRRHPPHDFGPWRLVVVVVVVAGGPDMVVPMTSRYQGVHWEILKQGGGMALYHGEKLVAWWPIVNVRQMLAFQIAYCAGVVRTHE